jgi:hypothetical protein
VTALIPSPVVPILRPHVPFAELVCLSKCCVGKDFRAENSGNGGSASERRQGRRSSMAVLPKPLFCVVLPDSAVLIALFPNFGAVLATEAKLVCSPESDDNCNSESEDSLHYSRSPAQGSCEIILKRKC